jgi:hypothetical protein
VDWAHDLKDVRDFTTSQGIGPGGESWGREGGDEIVIVFWGGLEKKDKGTVEKGS